MRYEFVRDTLRKLLADEVVSTSGSLLAVCASVPERDLFVELGFTNVTISNLDYRMSSPDFSPFDWSYQNAQSLSLPNDSFDYVFVSDGLHHCDSPHRALVEMIRVSRKAVIVFESRDSLVMRLAVKFGLAADYEVEAVIGNNCAYGGVNNSDIPNYVYRWTEREFEKTFNSYVPYGQNDFSYYYALHLPHERLAMGKSLFKRIVVKAVIPLARLIEHIAPRQGNSFLMVGRKSDHRGGLWPWLKNEDGAIRFNRKFSQRFT